LQSTYRILIFTVLIISSLSILGCSKTSTNAVVATKADTVNVETAKVVTAALDESAVLSGKLEALDSANIVAKSAGKVASIAVDVGSTVSAEQIMISLEADDLAATLNLALAGVDSAQLTFDLATKQYERGKALAGSGAVSQADFDNDYEGAYKKAEIGLRSAQATLEQSQAKYNDSFIKSPLNGIVTARNINVGEQANSASTLLTVMNLDKVVVVVNVNEDQVNRIQVGQELNIKVAAVSPDQIFKGVIKNIALSANASSKVFPVKVQIDNSDHSLKPGMFAEVTFKWAEKSGLLAPINAVSSDGVINRVYLVQDGVAKQTRVVTGPSDAKNIMIVSGLKDGDEVIINTPNTVKDGIKVKTRS